MGKYKGYKIRIAEDYFVYRDFPRRFDKRLVSDYKKGEYNPVNEFIEDIYEQLNIKASKINEKEKKEALNTIITNILVSTQQGRVLAFPRTKAVYANSKAYGLDYYTHTNVVGGADALKQAEYIEQINGYYDRDIKKGEYTRLLATEKLIDVISSKAEKPLSMSNDNEEEPCRINYLFDNKLRRRRFSNPIILKDEQKNIIQYKMKNAILKMRLFLNDYNQFLDENSVTIPEYTILNRNTIPFNPDFQSATRGIQWYGTEGSSPLLSQREVKCFNLIELDCWLYRVFNNRRFDQGGRFYGGGYQSLSEEVRAKIQINGNPIVEADFKALHPRMIYNREGINYNGDPYKAVSNADELRTPIKKMMQILINAKSEREAISAFEFYLEEESEVAEAVYGNGLDGRELVGMIKRTHRRIEDYFNSGIGVKLQYRDSKIAERILKHFTRKMIVCLCVHDSFLVERHYQDELVELMKKEHKREMGFEGEVEVNYKEKK